MGLPDIRIPAELLPGDGRFNCGPSKIRPAQLDALSAVAAGYLGTSHRQRTVRDQVARLRRGIAELFRAPDGYEVVLGNGGTTAFWEVATFGLVRERAQLASFGEFGQKLVDSVTAAPFLADPSVRSAPAGTVATLVAEDGVDTYGTPQNETSTGAAVPVRRVGDGLMLHDATSGAGGLPVDLTETDVYYFAPQKCLGSEGGLWIALLSPAALDRAAEITASGRYVPAFLDLTTAIDNSRKDQTYNTPSLATILLAAEQVDWILGNGGLDWSVARCAESAAVLYDWADRTDYTTPFVAEPASRSTVVGTVDLADHVDAAAVSGVLRENGVLDTEPYRKLGRNQLRVALFPSIEPADVAALTRCVDHVVGQLA
ncbi:phosphoserine transaminase [Actinocatenispora rupis]|uniref:phosphoserine transaminase n=1 Tax=Actinocatenispora rupis TaxID=519421 RepID=A0A8J3JD60_9ACTN|nr:phosphoserine transaminase [Actinocatenispora rupis]GID13798.1 phosphoserine aminotransferase [Actinocatenispora rupis]